MNDEELRRVLGEEGWRLFVQRKDELISVLLEVLQEGDEDAISTIDGADDCSGLDLLVGADRRPGGRIARLWASDHSHDALQLEIGSVKRFKDVTQYEWFALGVMMILFAILVMERLGQ